jgi:hypothetical protein
VTTTPARAAALGLGVFRAIALFFIWTEHRAVRRRQNTWKDQPERERSTIERKGCSDATDSFGSDTGGRDGGRRNRQGADAGAKRGRARGSPCGGGKGEPRHSTGSGEGITRTGGEGHRAEG